MSEKIAPYDHIYSEIQGGGLSILSDKAIRFIMDRVRWAMQEAYSRGLEDGAARATKASKATAAVRAKKAKGKR